MSSKIYRYLSMNTFGENLKSERTAKKMSQRELANKLGVSQQQVSQWELNKVEPTLSNIVAIIRTLEITFEDLLDNVDIASLVRSGNEQK